MPSGGEQNSPFLNLLRIKAAIVMGIVWVPPLGARGQLGWKRDWFHN